MKKRKVDPALQEFADRPEHKKQRKLRNLIDYGFSHLSLTTQRDIKQGLSLAGSAKHLSYSSKGGGQKGAAMQPVYEEICRRGKEIKDREGWPWKIVALKLLEKLKADEQRAREAGNITQADFLKSCQKSYDRTYRILTDRKRLLRRPK